ncbi:GPI mannosyltransferase 3 [Hondaea fermentalgiana]|uniref:Mannosyltransferase n=1 Tax=Hondaea fermentalgiana TaxID=2315210 RepID=A0A2R5GIV8_9STRA|nr:GPI mannosyltransferase 3 [Hondaea fermentalgiana]|eukprot:GBG29658.1 GPI mannosyltransferase 3 [Hondaea fermentalgiana]
MTERFRFLLVQALPVGAAALAIMMLVDRWGYGSWTFVPYNFFRVNVLENVSAEYGVHAWHWYLTQCIPAITGTWLPAIALGIRESLRPGHRRVRVLAEFVLWGLIVLSVTGHKELRFALPLMGPLSVLAGLGLVSISASTKRKVYIIFACASNVVVAAYLSRFHQRAPLPLMDVLAQAPPISGNGTHFVDFYTRCHATPYWSHVHGAPISRMRFLDCSPALPALATIPMMSKHVLEGIEEEDAFFANPLDLLRRRLMEQRPTRLVFSTESVSDVNLAKVRDEHEYTECGRFPHTRDIDYVLLCDVRDPDQGQMSPIVAETQ